MCNPCQPQLRRHNNLVTGHTFLNVDKMKTIQARWTLENLTSPIPVQQLIIQPPLPRLSDRISENFHKTDPIHATLISGTTLCIILIFALPCAIRCCCLQLIQPCCPTSYFSHRERTKRKSKRAARKAARQLVKSITKTPSAPTVEEMEAQLQLICNIVFN